LKKGDTEMSIYDLIDTKKIDVIVDAVFNGLQLTTPANLELAKSKLEFLGLPKEWHDDTKTAFGKRLLRTNLDALIERYPFLKVRDFDDDTPEPYEAQFAAGLERIVDQYEYAKPRYSTQALIRWAGNDEFEVRALFALKELKKRCAGGRVIKITEVSSGYAGILALISALESEIAEIRLRAYKKEYEVMTMDFGKYLNQTT
jgi:hypothetical protein